MKKEGVLIGLLAFFALAVLLISNTSGSVFYVNSTVDRYYSTGDSIRGTINISFSEEFAQTLFTSNFNGSAKLIDTLKSNGYIEKKDFNCTNKNCSVDYGMTTNSPATSVTLDGSSSKIIGFKIVGDGITVKSAKLSLTSDAAADCNRQLLIDVLDKGEKYLQNTEKQMPEEVCGTEYNNCFDASAATGTMAVLSNIPYCENVTLPPAQAYRIGATVKNGTAYSELKMQMRDQNFDPVTKGECVLPQHTIDGMQELTCVVNYSSIKTQSYFVCINVADGTDYDYRIRRESTGRTCGVAASSPPLTLSTDFEITAKSLKFAPVGTVAINETTFKNANEGASLADYLNDYIQAKYRGNCTPQCIIPIALSGTSQSINIVNSEITYTDSLNLLTPESSIYALDKVDSKVTTKQLLLDLGKMGFTIPAGQEGIKTFALYFGGVNIMTAGPINISAGYAMDITPKKVSIGVNTLFSLSISTAVSNVKWTFGDGTTGNTNNKTIYHRYTAAPASKEFDLGVEVTRTDGTKISKSFKIGVENVSQTAHQLFDSEGIKLNNITNQLKTFSPWVAQKILEKLKIANINSTLDAIRLNWGNITTDEQYLALINQIVGLDSYSGVYIKEKGLKFPMSIGLSNIDTSYIKEISNVQVSDDNDANLKAAIIGWIEHNYNVTIDYDKIYASGALMDSPILTKFTLTANKASSGTGNYYLVLAYPRSSITFKENYSEKIIGSGTYIPITGTKTIEFILMSDVNPASLGMYISPNINEIYTSADTYKPKTFRWTGFLIFMLILLLAAFIVYVILQEWYKMYYEAYLFKNKDDLYNLISFIYNSRKAGLKDDEIRQKLKEKKWDSERISYAFKKADGKRIGLFEIPVLKWWENRKLREELAKRQTQSLLNQGKI